MPGGGDCEGRIDAIMASRDTELSPAGRKSAAMSIGAKPGNAGVTTAVGVPGLAAQQPALTDGHGMPIWEQQLCAALCAGITQVPMESSNTPIRVMAIAVRWLTPRNIVSA